MANPTSNGLPIWDSSSAIDQAKPYSQAIDELMGTASTSAMNVLNKAVPKLQTAAEWTADTTTILDVGQMGVESDTSKFKFGDGTNTWANLSYVSALPDGGSAGQVVTKISTGSEWGDVVKYITLTLDKDDWTGTEAPFSLTVNSDDIAANSCGVVKCASSSLTSYTNSGVALYSQSDGSLTFRASTAKPLLDLFVNITLMYGDGSLMEIAASSSSGTLPQSSITLLSVTLDKDDWTGDSAPYTQSVAATGCLEDNSVAVNYSTGDAVNSDGRKQFYLCDVVMSAQDDDSVTFTAQSVPTSDITVNLEIIVPSDTVLDAITAHNTDTTAHSNIELDFTGGGN